MTAKRPRIAAIGLASWDVLVAVDHYPGPGGYEEVSASLSAPGGTTTNTAVALARLGADVTLRAVTGDDELGQTMRDHLAREGVDVSGVTVRTGEPTDASTIIVSQLPPDRTILWHRGAMIVKGDRLDIAGLFSHDVVILDMDDMPLRRFLSDLPAHTRPDVRILGTLTYLADAGHIDALDVALRSDVLVGNERQFCQLAGVDEPETALSVVVTHMRAAQLQVAVMSQGSRGCTIATENERWQIPAYPATCVDATGAGDAFAAGTAYGMAQRWDWPRTGRFANALGALAIRALGAQTALPTMADVEAMQATHSGL